MVTRRRVVLRRSPIRTRSHQHPSQSVVETAVQETARTLRRVSRSLDRAVSALASLPATSSTSQAPVDDTVTASQQLQLQREVSEQLRAISALRESPQLAVVAPPSQSDTVLDIVKALCDKLSSASTDCGRVCMDVLQAVFERDNLLRERQQEALTVTMRDTSAQLQRVHDAMLAQAERQMSAFSRHVLEIQSTCTPTPVPSLPSPPLGLSSSHLRSHPVLGSR
jgi:hypothetical protein